MAGSFKVAPYGAGAWIYTIIFLATFLFFLVRSVMSLASGLLPSVYDGGAALLLLGFVIYGWLRSVRGYEVANREVVVQRAGPGRVHFAVDEMQSVKVKPDLGSFFNAGFLSIGGLFGWAGRARVRNPTDIRSLDAIVYGTNADKSVVLEMKNGRTIILTPADPQGLAAALREAGLRDQGAETRAWGSGPGFKTQSQTASKRKKQRR